MLKIKKSETFEEAAALLERIGIFDVETWMNYNYEHYEKWRIVADSLLQEARNYYCKFPLYQSLGVSENNNRDASRVLLSIVENEGFSPQCFMGIINRWMGSYSQVKSSLNTLYVVGGPRTYAETFCNSIVNIFSCVVTYDLHQAKHDSLFMMANQIKMLYFPPTKQQRVDNPYITSILSGRQFMVTVGEKMLRVPQIKCLVRMNELPNMEDLVTSKDQHFIICFKEEVQQPINFNVHEMRRHIKTYLQNELEAENRTPTICNNQYSVLCSVTNSNFECHRCSQLYHF